MTQDEAKKKAAEAALKYLVSGEPLGVGTGSTVNHFIDLLAAHKGDVPAAVSAGATPAFVASRETFTCTQTCSGASSAGRWSERRRAIFSRSTAWTQSKCRAISAVLFDCTGPMKCQRAGPRGAPASAAIFGNASCT